MLLPTFPCEDWTRRHRTLRIKIPVLCYVIINNFLIFIVTQGPCAGASGQRISASTDTLSGASIEVSVMYKCTNYIFIRLKHLFWCTKTLVDDSWTKRCEVTSASPACLLYRPHRTIHFCTKSQYFWRWDRHDCRLNFYPFIVYFESGYLWRVC